MPLCHRRTQRGPPVGWRHQLSFDLRPPLTARLQLTIIGCQHGSRRVGCQPVRWQAAVYAAEYIGCCLAFVVTSIDNRSGC